MGDQGQWHALSDDRSSPGEKRAGYEAGRIRKSPVTFPCRAFHKSYEAALQRLLRETLNRINTSDLLRQKVPLWVEEAQALKLGFKQTYILIKRR